MVILVSFALPALRVLSDVPVSDNNNSIIGPPFKVLTLMRQHFGARLASLQCGSLVKDDSWANAASNGLMRLGSLRLLAAA